MKNIAEFTASKVKDGYEVFVYWEKRYKFPSKRLADKFIVQANSLLFTELFKVNELLIDIFPEVQRLLFMASPHDKVNITDKLESINEMLKYCHFSQGPNKTVYVISKIEQSYNDLKQLNEILLSYGKKSSNTLDVYKSKVFADRLEMSQRDFLEFKFVRLEKLIKNEEIPVLRMAV